MSHSEFVEAVDKYIVKDIETPIGRRGFVACLREMNCVKAIALEVNYFSRIHSLDDAPFAKNLTFAQALRRIIDPRVKRNLRLSKKLQEGILKAFHERWDLEGQEVDEDFKIRDYLSLSLSIMIEHFGAKLISEIVESLIDTRIDFCSYEVFKLAEGWETYKDCHMPWALNMIDLNAILGFDKE